MNIVRNLSGTIPDAVFEIARRRPDRIAMQIREEQGYRQCSFRQLIEQAEGIAAALLHHDLRRGDRVALLSENRPEWLIAYVGILAAGCTVIPLDIQLNSTDLARLLVRSGAKLGFVSAATWPLLKQTGVPLIFVSFDPPQDSCCFLLAEWLRTGRSDGVEQHPVLPDDVAAILYTSGTTGEPKGVCLTHRNLLSNVEALAQTGLGREEDQFLGILPLHHAYPFMATGLIPLLLGARVTFLPSLKGPLLLQCLREAGITILVGVPQVFAMMRRAIAEGIDRRPRAMRMLITVLMACVYLVRRRTAINPGRILFGSVHHHLGPSLRLLVSGGARLDPDVARFFISLGFTLLEGYGLTETAPVVTFTSPARMKPGSVGSPIPGVAVRIANPDSSGVGEVAVAGPNVMRGYDGDPTATADAIRDGWFHTGDVGYLDRDGDLFLTGRAKELIVTAGGKNIVPEELESLYRRSPAIGEICIVGVTRAGEGGAALHAVVVPDFDYVKTLKIVDVRQLIKTELTRIGLTLPSYQRMSGLTIVRTPLPRTRLEKLQRHRVAAMLKTAGEETETASPASAEDLTLMETRAARQVIRALQPFVGSDRVIIPSDHLDLDLGFDSLRRVELVAALEQSFGRLPESLAHEVITVRELIERVRDTHPEQLDTGSGARSWEDILRAPPPAALRDTVLAPRVRSHHLLGLCARALCRCGLLAGFRLRMTGAEHLNVNGPCLLAANHTSVLDPLVIIATVPGAMFTRLYAIGWQPFFRGAFLRWVARVGRVIPVGSEASLVSALQAGALVLRQGQNLLVFPEGQRSVDGTLDVFRPGIGILACEFRVPVIPLRIDGTFQAMPVGRRWPRRHPISLSVGPPLRVTQELIDHWRTQGRDPYQAATEAIRDAVVALGPSAGAGRPTTGGAQQ
ncbi:MAG TPA: AMP-binding protein [Nitrospira sp.]|nr:AMP-binding protein [Nitrospira sp.]